jgi:hypothetical protein
VNREYRGPIDFQSLKSNLLESVEFLFSFALSLLLLPLGFVFSVPRRLQFAKL